VTSGAAGSPHRFEVTAKRFEFSPAEITVKRGENVVLAVHSDDVHHGLTFKELGVTVDVPKGKTVEISFTPSIAGTFVGICNHFCGRGHGQMQLVLKVTD
jgi:cytochrome c oxidase subunit 2